MSIEYDFALGRSVAANLESISESTDNKVLKAFQEEITMLSEFWAGDTAEMFFKQSDRICKKIKMLRDEIQIEAETLKKITEKIYAAEQEAESLSENSVY